MIRICLFWETVGHIPDAAQEWREGIGSSLFNCSFPGSCATAPCLVQPLHEVPKARLGQDHVASKDPWCAGKVNEARQTCSISSVIFICSVGLSTSKMEPIPSCSTTRWLRSSCDRSSGSGSCWWVQLGPQSGTGASWPCRTKHGHHGHAARATFPQASKEGSTEKFPFTMT